MKAIVYERYGGPEVLHLKEIERPQPKHNEILIRVRATSVNFGDLIARRFKYLKRKEFSMLGLFYYLSKLAFGLSKPRIKVLGSEFSGVVESVGTNVKAFKPGNEVFGFSGQKMGCYAEYLLANEKSCIALKPSNLSFEQAAISPYGAIMALPLLRKANIKSGQKVLIHGASGGIGSAAVQIAKSLGAKVDGVCSTPNTEWVKKLGVDKVFDYKKEDFTQNDAQYDLIIDIQGKLSFSRCKKSLTQNGKLLYVSFKTGKLLQSVFNARIICALAPANSADMREVKNFFDSGVLITELDTIFPMEQAAEAHRYVEEKMAKGKVAIRINPR
jgi:NADPH:quinone reductase-like Zn-dependent oxidoreductase